MEISNKIFIDQDCQANIIYRLDLLTQQKYRWVSHHWRDIIDNNPSREHLSSYFVLLRNPRQGHSTNKNKSRVLRGAVFYNEHDLVEAILKCSEEKKIYEAFRRESPYALQYNPSYFLRYTQDNEMKKILGYKDFEKSKKLEKPHLIELVAVSFLGNSEKIQEIMNIIHVECLNRDNHFLNNNNWDVDTNGTLLEIFRIIIDYDDVQALSVLVNSFNQYGGLSIDSFFESIRDCYECRSLKSMEFLLSSMTNINQVKIVDSWAGENTIKDDILRRLIVEKDNNDCIYNKSVHSLFNKYGAKTYKEILKHKEDALRYNTLKKTLIGITIVTAGWFLYKYWNGQRAR